MASIVKRRKKFSVVYSYVDERGEKRQKWETFSTMADAKKRKAEIETQQEDGTFQIPTCTTLDELLEELNRIEQENTYSPLIKVLASGICTFGFAFFFHGTLQDACVAFVCGCLLQMLLYWLSYLGLDNFFKNVTGGAFVTLFSFFCMKLGLCQSLDTAIISVLMLLVPGLAITNAMRDTVSGDLISGTSRIMEALIIAVAIAVGSGLIFALLGGI